jgi:hypothetical protein
MGSTSLDMSLNVASRKGGLARHAIGASLLCLACAAGTVPVLAQTSANVTVNVSSGLANVPAEGYGVDSSVYDGYMLSSGLGASLKSGGFNAIRYPGGSYADIFNFISGSNQTLNDGGYFAPGDTFNNFMSTLVAPSGAKPVITVNYGSNVNNNGPALPSTAASWVQYANVTNHYGIKYWEIGNEVVGNGYYGTGLDWEYDLHDLDQTPADRVGYPALSATAYGTNAAAFIKAMKAVDPTIKCGIGVFTQSWLNTYDRDVLTAISNALQGSGYTLDFVIYHWYPGGTNAQILAAQSGIPALAAQYRSDIQSYYTLSNASQLQFGITESGSGLVSGIFEYLFAVDEYLTWFESGAANVDYQELHSGVYEGSTSNTGFGPWYGVQFASTIARVGDRLVSANSSNSLLRVHGVKRTDGQVGVLLINDDPSNSTTVAVGISGATLATTGTQYTFGNANFASGSSAPSSGISSKSISGVGSSFNITVPAYTTVAVLIPQSSTNSSNLIANGTYVIANNHSELAVDDYGWSTQQGTNMVQWSATGGTNQKWTLTNLGNNYVELVNGTSGYALDVSGASQASGAAVIQWPYHSGANQIWKVVSKGNGLYELLNQNSGLALSVPGLSTSNGTNLDQETVTGADNQLWSFAN